MADLKVDYDGADANSISIYASPETLRAIADQMEERVMVWAKGKAVDIDEQVTICFEPELEEAP